MARLFLTSREIDFINDVSKELIKDVVGQKVYYYKVRPEYTDIHEVYEEAIDKIFDPPIELECRIPYEPNAVRTNKFGTEEFYTINCWFHFRDVIERDIQISEGDFFSFDGTWFEVVTATLDSVIYGQIEHGMGFHVTCKQARYGLVNKDPLGPTSELWSDAESIQSTFVQQRGFETNRLGETADVRNLQQKGVLDAPISGPAEVSPDGLGNDKISSSFYDET